VAQALAKEVSPGRPSGAAQVAHHYRLAGLEGDAAEFYRLAGDHARSLHANAEAAAHYQAALDGGHPRACELHERLGELEVLNGLYGAGLSSYQAAAALAGPGRLPLIEHRIAGIYLRQGTWHLAEEHLLGALEGLGSDDLAGERARVTADRSLLAHRRGDQHEAASLAHDALLLAEQADDVQALAQAHNILGILNASQGEFDLATGHLKESLKLASQLGDDAARVAALNNLALTLRGQGDLSQAETLMQEALAICQKLSDRHREAALHNNLADTARAAGRTDEAMSQLKLAAALFAEVGADKGDLEPEIWKLVEW
jgi:tetratricopeptide (TPR) repeat protein